LVEHVHSRYLKASVKTGPHGWDLRDLLKLTLDSTLSRRTRLAACAVGVGTLILFSFSGLAMGFIAMVWLTF
jgi:hypothetical protein